MSKKVALILSIVGIVLLVVIYAGMSISYSNSEIELKNGISAQQEVCEAHFDKMFKILKQQAGVADKYAKDFQKIYPGLIEGRYSGDGGQQLMKWVTEHNPDYKPDLLNKLMNSVERERESFFQDQKVLISKKQEHDNLRQKFPGSYFLSDIKEIEITIVKSSNTKKVYETGEENDIDLF